MNKSKILVVDDEQGICDLITTVFGEDYQIKAAGSAKEALDLISNWHPNIVFLDIVLPDQDGIKTLSEIKKKNNDTTVFIITGQGTLQRAEEAMNEGAEDYILKPFNIKNLQDLTQNILKIKKLEKEVSELKSKLKKSEEDGDKS